MVGLLGNENISNFSTFRLVFEHIQLGRWFDNIDISRKITKTIVAIHIETLKIRK